MTDAEYSPEGDDSGVPSGPLLDAVGALPIVLWTTDRELRMTSSAGGAIDEIGQRGARIGLTLQQIVGSDDPNIPAIRAHREALEGRSANYEQLAFGRSWQAHVEPIVDLERRVVGVAGVSIDVTDRRETEDALRESATRFRQLSDASFEGIALHDMGVLIDANASFCRMFGYTLPEVVGRSVLELAGPGSRDDVLNRIKSGSEDPYEAKGLRKDGTEFIAELRGSPIALEGRTVRVTAVRDITERKRAEEELARSEGWLRALLSSMSEVVSVLDADGRYVDISSRYPDLLYRSTDELKGKTMAEVFPAEEAGFFLDHVRRALSTQATVECEYRLEVDGGEKWFTALVSPLSDTQVVWVARDTTERKEAELALERGEAKFRALFEAGAEAFVLVGADGIIDRVNQTAEAVFGYSKAELEGQPLNILVPEAFRSTHSKKMRDFVNDPAARPLNAGLALEARRKDGTTFPAEISLSYVTTDTGVLAMAAVTDETERRRAEDELKESLERLRESDAERGRLLASLVVAQEEERGRMARELHDDAIQVMTAAELRVQTFALKDPSSREALSALGETIRSAIGRLRTSLIGLRPPVLENVGVASALRAHVDTMREDSGLEFTIDDRWEREPALETRVTIYRIVLEALTNVRKYAQATSVTITLEPAAGGFGASIRDNGRGFDQHASEMGAPGHMGLMIMRERAELAGGELEITSSPGAGTVVAFWVPDVPAP